MGMMQKKNQMKLDFEVFTVRLDDGDVRKVSRDGKGEWFFYQGKVGEHHCWSPIVVAQSHGWDLAPYELEVLYRQYKKQEFMEHVDFFMDRIIEDAKQVLEGKS